MPTRHVRCCIGSVEGPLLVDWERSDQHWGGMGPHLLEAGIGAVTKGVKMEEMRMEEKEILDWQFAFGELNQT